MPDGFYLSNDHSLATISEPIGKLAGKSRAGVFEMLTISVDIIILGGIIFLTGADSCQKQQTLA